jgi:hypothetical protein
MSIFLFNSEVYYIMAIQSPLLYVVVRFQVLTAASMMFREMMEAVRTSETSVDNHFTRQYNPEDSSEHCTLFFKTF